MTVDYGEVTGLDAGIYAFVRLLRAHGVETFESCQGGEGHAFRVPTIRFHGGVGEGWKALAVAQEHKLPVEALMREWPIIDNDPTGPYWVMTFYRIANEFGR